MVLEAKRLLLREMNPDDDLALFLVFGDPETMWHYPYTFDGQHIRDWMNGNGYFGKVIESGHVYELGYEKCTCPKVLSGQITDPDHCNCSRQSILYILSQQEPDSEFEVDILETVLNGAEYCRFRITKK